MLLIVMAFWADRVVAKAVLRKARFQGPYWMQPKNGEKLSSLTLAEPVHTTLAKQQMLQSLKDQGYRAAFVEERVKSSIALQIRALREQRNKMTQKQLGEAIGMAQTWVSRLENPEYGKMTVATLLRLATQAFDTDLEIKFRPFSQTINSVPTQGPGYFSVPSFDEELAEMERDRDESSDGLARLAAGNEDPSRLRPRTPQISAQNQGTPPPIPESQPANSTDAFSGIARVA